MNMTADQFSATVQAPENKRHPHGTFRCVIESLSKGQYPNTGRAYVSMQPVTSHGKAPDVRVNLIGDLDVQAAQADPEVRKKVVTMVEMFKGQLVKMGECSEDEVGPMTQTDMIQRFAQVKGKEYMVTILADKQNPQYSRSYIDKLDPLRLTDIGDTGTSVIPSMPEQATQPPVQPTQPPVQSQSPAQPPAQPPVTPTSTNLDDIPF